MTTMSGHRLLAGVIPYGERALVGNPVADRLMPGCFAASLRRRHTIPIVLGQGRDRPIAAVARSTCTETHGLLVVAAAKAGPIGDEFLDDVRQGYLTGLAVEITDARRATTSDGTIELHQAKLALIAAVATPAFDGARIIATGPNATDRAMAVLTSRIPPAPTIDLSPIRL